MPGKRGQSQEEQDLHQYLVSHSVHSTSELDGLEKDTFKQERSGMMSPPDSVAILQLLLKLTSAKKVIEVGTFTGYMTLGLALGLPSDGRVYTLDISEEYVNVGKPWWQKAGVDKQITFLIGPASESLDSLTEELGAGSIDLGFVDADKDNYDTYVEQLLVLLRPGGVLVVDNVLWGGSVLDDSDQTTDTKAIRAVNAKLYKDPRVQVAMLKNSDGITVAYKL